MKKIFSKASDQISDKSFGNTAGNSSGNSVGKAAGKFGKGPNAKTDKNPAKKIAAGAFDKYDLYRRAVQCPESDIDFLLQAYSDVNGVTKSSADCAFTMREDFCGTFANCKEWISRALNHLAVGLDLDPEPIEYGIKNHAELMPPEELARLDVRLADVLSKKAPEADVVCALNFSYSLFKERAALKKYFKSVHPKLLKNGIFVLDCFGGPDYSFEHEEVIPKDDFTYYWHQEGFDQATGEATFNIHFKLRGQKKVNNVFTYDWRMWSVPELRDILFESGFSNVHLYWEGTEADGSGDGFFSRTESVREECQAWIAYLVAEK
jgi:SAM-dependent methyltransferase